MKANIRGDGRSVFENFLEEEGSLCKTFGRHPRVSLSGPPETPSAISERMKHSEVQPIEGGCLWKTFAGKTDHGLGEVKWYKIPPNLPEIPLYDLNSC